TMIAKMDQDVDVVLKDDKEVADEAKEVSDAVKDVQESAQDQGRTTESQAEIYKIDLDHTNKKKERSSNQGSSRRVYYIHNGLREAIYQAYILQSILLKPMEVSNTHHLT
nr:hypothetical protein [Tanacetum cinerariifolium]